MGFIVSRLQAYLSTATTSGSTSSSSSKLVSAHFGVVFHAASVLLSAVQLAAVGLGAEEPKIAAACNTEVGLGECSCHDLFILLLLLLLLLLNYIISIIIILYL